MKHKVLVIDDDQSLLEILQTNLQAEGFEVVTASSGSEGLAKLKSDKPDLVILDVLMPGMDGWEVLRKIEEDPDTAGTPVVMLTAVHGTDQVIRGLEEGAVEYITKPFYPADLIATVKIMLKVFDPSMRRYYREQLIAKRKRSLLRK